MSDFFNCPECRLLAPRPTDLRAFDEGVCDSCWYELRMHNWHKQQWFLYGERKRAEEMRKRRGYEKKI